MTLLSSHLEHLARCIQNCWHSWLWMKQVSHLSCRALTFATQLPLPFTVVAVLSLPRQIDSCPPSFLPSLQKTCVCPSSAAFAFLHLKGRHFAAFRSLLAKHIPTYRLTNCVRKHICIGQTLQGWCKEWSLGCVNPAPWLPLAAGGGAFHAT